MALQLYQLPLAFSLSSSSSSPSSSTSAHIHFLFCCHLHHQQYTSSLNENFGKKFRSLCLHHDTSNIKWRRKKTGLLVDREDLELRVQKEEQEEEEGEGEAEKEPPSPQDLQYVQEVKRVLELLRKNRDMLFGEVKLTKTIEDPRVVKQSRLLGIEDPDAPTREDLVEALEQMNEGSPKKSPCASNAG